MNLYLAASDRIDVIVSTVVIPKDTLAGVASTAIQNETQLRTRVKHFVIFEKLVFAITSRILRIPIEYIDSI